MRGPLRIECLRSSAELARLERIWNPLLRRTACNCIFLTWEWVSRWWWAFGEPFSLRVVVVRDERGEIVGIAPLIINAERRLMLLGQAGETRAEQLDLLVVRGLESEVTPRICRYALRELSDEWETLSFERVLQDSPNLRPMLEALNRDPWKARVVRRESAPYIKLDGSWDEYLAGRTKSFRNNWRRSSRRLDQRGEVSVLVAGDDLPFQEAFAHLIRLHRERWGDDKGKFRTERYLRFHEALARELLQKGLLCLLLLAVHGRVVAVSYDFVYSGKVWAMQGGWDPNFAHERVGSLLLGEAVRWAIRNGQSEYDLLGGSDAYKRWWATHERVMVYLDAIRPRTR